LGVKAAQAAVAPLELQPLGKGDDRMMLPGDREKLEVFQPPAEPRYVLISPIDAIVLLRRSLKDLLDPKDARGEVLAAKGMQPLGMLADLPGHAILDRGRVVGLWEYDTETESIAWTAFIKKDHALEDAVARTEQYVREQLGDVRSFSLDSPRSRAPRVAALRKAAAR
jgi:hypothetical protein